MKHENTSIFDWSTQNLLIYGTPLLLFLPFEWTIAVILFCLARWVYQGKMNNIIHRTPHISLLLAFGILQVISSLFSENLLGLVNAIGTLAIVLFVAKIISQLNPETFEKMLKQTGKLSMFAAILAIIEFAFLASRNNMTIMQSLVDMPPQSRISLTYFNPNLYATMIIFFLIVTTYFFFKEENRHKKIGWSIVFLTNLVALFMTGCRSAFVDLLVIFPIFFMIQNKKKLLAFTLGSETVGIVTLLTHPDLMPRLSHMDSIYARISIWRTTLLGIIDKPLIGGGPQYYQMLSQEMGSVPAAHAHNLLLEMLLSNGIVGTVLMAVYGYRIVSATNQSRFVKERPLYRALLCAVLSAVLIEGLVDYTINFPATAMFFLFVVSAPAVMETSQENVVQPFASRPASIIYDYYFKPVAQNRYMNMQPTHTKSQVVSKSTYPITRIKS